MKTSESITKLAPALLAAQKAITFAVMDTLNPHFKKKYADLPSVIDAIKVPLNDVGIVFVQSASPSEPGYLAMTTRLIHESGEWIEDTATIPLPKSDPQGYGSASTYARRYALAAITGLYQDDDDGNSASRKEPPPNAKEQPPAAKKPMKETYKALDLRLACSTILSSPTVQKAERFADIAFDRATTDAEKKEISAALQAYMEKAA